MGQEKNGRMIDQDPQDFHSCFKSHKEINQLKMEE